MFVRTTSMVHYKNRISGITELTYNKTIIYFLINGLEILYAHLLNTPTAWYAPAADVEDFL